MVRRKHLDSRRASTRETLLTNFLQVNLAILLVTTTNRASDEKMAKQVNCDCGFMVRAQSDDELVQHVQLHAREIHQMDVPRDKALEMAKPVEATVTI
jgi:predicted small metal-binding protein